MRWLGPCSQIQYPPMWIIFKAFKLQSNFRRDCQSQSFQSKGKTRYNVFFIEFNWTGGWNLCFHPSCMIMHYQSSTHNLVNFRIQTWYDNFQGRWKCIDLKMRWCGSQDAIHMFWNYLYILVQCLKKTLSKSSPYPICTISIEAYIYVEWSIQDIGAHIWSRPDTYNVYI